MVIIKYLRNKEGVNNFVGINPKEKDDLDYLVNSSKEFDDATEVIIIRYNIGFRPC